MNKRVMMEKAAYALDAKIMLTYLKNSGWTKEMGEWKDFIRENREDFLEYREWYLACYA